LTSHLLILRGSIGSGKTSVAQGIANRRPNTKVIEVDDLKILRYGTREQCHPSSIAGADVKAEIRMTSRTNPVLSRHSLPPPLDRRTALRGICLLCLILTSVVP